MDLRKLNDACVHDPFPTPFTNKVLDNVGGQGAYSFTEGSWGTTKSKLHWRIGARQPLLLSGVVFSPL